MLHLFVNHKENKEPTDNHNNLKNVHADTLHYFTALQINFMKTVP